jgi:magnesium transporter
MLERIDKNPGAAPGVEPEELYIQTGEFEQAILTCIDYSPSQFEIQEVQELADFLARHRPAWSAVRWINLAGLSDRRAIQAQATKYNLHPLAVEDVLHLSQRPKIEPYGGDTSEFRLVYSSSYKSASSSSR